MLYKVAWVVTLLGTLLGVKDYKKVKFSGRDISSLAAEELNKNIKMLRKKSKLFFGVI